MSARKMSLVSRARGGRRDRLSGPIHVIFRYGMKGAEEEDDVTATMDISDRIFLLMVMDKQKCNVRLIAHCFPTCQAGLLSRASPSSPSLSPTPITNFPHPLMLTLTLTRLLARRRQSPTLPVFTTTPRSPGLRNVWFVARARPWTWAGLLPRCPWTLMLRNLLSSRHPRSSPTSPWRPTGRGRPKRHLLGIVAGLRARLLPT